MSIEFERGYHYAKANSTFINANIEMLVFFKLSFDGFAKRDNDETAKGIVAALDEIIAERSSHENNK